MSKVEKVEKISERALTLVEKPLPVVIEGLDSSEIEGLVTRPVLQHPRGEVVQVRIIAPLILKQNVNKKSGEVHDLFIAIVIDRFTQMEHMYVCNAVTASELIDKFPNESYVDKSFAIWKGNPTKGNQFCEVKIVRLKDGLF